MLQPHPPDVVADCHAPLAEQHVQVALGAAERGGNLVDAEIGIAQTLADEGLRPDIHRLGPDPAEGRIRLAQRQQQEIDQRLGDAGGAVGREFRRLVERRMHEVMGYAPRAVARRQLAGRHPLRMEAALAQELLRHDDDLMARESGAHDRMRTGDVVGKTIARHHLDATSVLLEIGHAVGLEDDLDVGMLAGPDPPVGMRDAVLTDLDLAEFQPGHRGVVDPSLQRRRFHRIDVEPSAKIGQRV